MAKMPNSQYARMHFRIDDGIAYRDLHNSRTLATHTATCPACGEPSAIVDGQMVTARLYDRQWIEQTLKTKAVTGLPAA